MREICLCGTSDHCHLEIRGDRRTGGPCTLRILHRSSGAKNAPQDDKTTTTGSKFGSLCPRHLNSGGVDLHITLNLHLERGADLELHFRTVLQQGPRNTTRDSREAAIASAVQATGGESANTADRATPRCTLRSIFHALASVFVGLNRAFGILHALVVSPRSILDVTGQHHRVPAGINH